MPLLAHTVVSVERGSGFAVLSSTLTAALGSRVQLKSCDKLIRKHLVIGTAQHVDSTFVKLALTVYSHVIFSNTIYYGY